MTTVSFALGQMTLQRPSWDPRTVSQLYADALDLVVLADELGYESFWLAEHHGAEDDYIPSTIPFLAAAAARTERIDVGTAVLLTPFHDPIRVAEDAAVLSLVSKGRLRLGLGLGWSAEEYRMFGAPTAGRGARLEEFVAVLRGAWGDGRFTHEGRHLRYEDVLVTPKPETPIPVYLGGASEAAVRRAARIADGYFPPSTAGGPVGVLEKVREVLALRQEAGVERPFSFGCFLPIGIGDSPDEAWASIRRGLLHTRGSYLRWSQGRRDLEGCDEDAAAWEDAVREQTVHGTPDQVIAALKPLVEGLRELPLERAFVSVILAPVGMDKATATTAVRRFAAEVMPAFA